MKEFDDRNAVKVNTDDLRAYHPRFDEIVMLDDKRSAERTHQDASEWKNKLLTRCLETKRNVVMEGVFKDKEGLLQTIELAKRNGYTVTVRVVAAHERFSVWGINRRYEKEKITRGHGRYVPIEYHDQCYRLILDSVDAIEHQRIAKCIEVYDRHGALVYSNEQLNGKWKDPPSARAKIEAERDRKLTDKEKKEYIESWPRVFEYMRRRRASLQEIDAVTAAAQSFIRDLG